MAHALADRSVQPMVKGFPQVAITSRNGRLGLSVVGERVQPYAYYLQRPIAADVAFMTAHGSPILTWGFSDLIPHSLDLGWCAEDQLDARGFDQECTDLLAAAPQAWLLPRVAVSAPRWWLESHPEDCLRYEDGEPATPATSLASVAWQRAACAAITRLVQHAAGQPYADRIIGFQVTGGRNEWFYDFSDRFGDFSPAAITAFRTWLQRRYGDDAALRHAWRDAAVTLATAQPPSGAQRLRGDRGQLRDPAQSLQVADHHRFYAECTADAFAACCDAVKQASEGRLLAGGFYGYLRNNHGCLAQGRIPWSTGHLALERALDHPAIDFIAAPYQMTHRYGGGYDGDQGLPESARRRGKLFFAEVTRGRLDHVAGSSHGSACVSDPLSLVKRNFATRLIQGSGMWWMDWWGSDFTTPQLAPFLSRCRTLLDQAAEIPSRRPEIAVVLDEESLFHLAVGGRMLYPYWFLQERMGLAQLGAPFDVVLPSDLLNGGADPYRLVIVLGCWYLGAQRRSELAAALQRDGRTVLWFHAPGLIDESGIDPAHAHELCGMRLGLSERTAVDGGVPVTLTLCDHQHPITAGLSASTTAGTAWPLAPMPFIDDPDATPLGTMFSTHEVEPVALAARSFADWRSVVSTVPNLPAPLLRGIARWAGCHIYSDGDDAVHCDGTWLSIHSAAGGPRSVRLPGPRRVEDAWSGAAVGDAPCETIYCELAPRETRMWRLHAVDPVADTPDVAHAAGTGYRTPSQSGKGR